MHTLTAATLLPSIDIHHTLQYEIVTYVQLTAPRCLGVSTSDPTVLATHSRVPIKCMQIIEWNNISHWNYWLSCYVNTLIT